MVEYQDYVRSTQDTLRVLAELTGGIAVVNQNDFTKALKRIDQETSDYYVVGYYSTNPDPTKRRRNIEVKVKRPGANVWHRTSYTLKKPTVSRGECPRRFARVLHTSFGLASDILRGCCGEFSPVTVAILAPHSNQFSRRLQIVGVVQMKWFSGTLSSLLAVCAVLLSAATPVIRARRDHRASQWCGHRCEQPAD